MKRRNFMTLMLVASLWTGGCAFVPKHNLRLEEARSAYDLAMADSQVARLAQAELDKAHELLERATIARNTLDDVAEVDHLAYLAKQRVAIGRETALQRALERDTMVRP